MTTRDLSQVTFRYVQNDLQYVGSTVYWISIGYTPRARLLSDLATECRRHKVAKSLGNQARGVQPACTMTTQNLKVRLTSSISLKSRLIT